VSPVKFEMDSYIPEGDILHRDRLEVLKSYILSFCSVDFFLLPHKFLRFYSMLGLISRESWNVLEIHRSGPVTVYRSASTGCVKLS
jgi:hypothetical protein